MGVSDLNWMQLERYLERDDRIVLPVASTEQHAYLSLATESFSPSGSRWRRLSRSECPSCRQEMLHVWQAGVEEVRDLLEQGWA